MSTVETVDDTGTNEFLVSLVVNLVLGVVFTLAFSFCRRRLPYFFDARRVDHLRNPAYRPGKLYLERPPRQARSFFGWLPQIIQLGEQSVMKTAGVDAIITLRFFLWMALYLSVYTLLAFVIIIPIQATADGNEISGFNSLSIMSLGMNDRRLFCHLVMIYVFTGALLLILRRMWQDNIKLKAQWLSDEQLAGRKMTVFLKDIPEQYRSDTALFAFFEELYPGKVLGASVVKEIPELIELYNERETLVNEVNQARGNIELELDGETYARWKHQQSQPNSTSGIEETWDERTYKIIHPRKKLKCLGLCGEEVDLFEYNAQRIAEIEDRMFHIYENQKDLPALSTGFVTFSNAITAASVVEVPIGKVNSFTTHWAPEPNDIRWFGVQKSYLYKFIMSMIMSVVHFFIVFFYMIPIGFISSLMTLQALSQRLPFLEPVLTMNGAIQGFLEGFLPSLAMVIFMALLPVILTAMGNIKGVESVSWVQQYVFRKYFVFQLVNFFLITAVSSSVLNQIDDIIKHPTKIPSLLASSLPQSAGLFVNYIMLRAFSGNVNLFDIDIVINYIKSLFARTPKAILEAYTPLPFKFGKEFPESILILIVAFCFGTIQPIILPFAAIYFFTMYLRNKFRFVYMVVTPYESGGGFWPLAFNRIILGVIIAQLTILGIFALKENYVASGLLVPLPLLTLWFWYFYHDLYTSTGHRLTLMDSATTDHTHDMLADEQRRALLEGYNLPLPAHASILPFIMPDRVADTVSRDRYIKQRQEELAQADPSQSSTTEPIGSPSSDNTEPLTSSMVECNGAGNNDPAANLHPIAQFNTIPSISPSLEEETQLSEQYFGDDIELQRKFRDFIKTCEIDPSTPQHEVFDEYKRKYFEQLDHMAMTDDPTALHPPSPISQVNDAENPIASSHFTMPVRHRVLIEKAVLRWKKSREQQQRMDAIHEQLEQQLASPSSNAAELIGSPSSVDGGHTAAGIDDDNALQSPTLSETALASISESHIPQKKFSFADRQSAPMSSPTVESPEIVLPDGTTPSPLEPPTRMKRSVSVSGLTRPIEIDSDRLENMTKVMSRYLQPQLDDSTYTPILDIIWGPSYLNYYRAKKGRK